MRRATTAAPRQPGPQRALIVGNSDGIGLELTRQLMAAGWIVTGLSRSACDVLPASAHEVCDVTTPGFRATLTALVERRGPFDACIFCVGIGEELEPHDFGSERRVFATNLLAAVDTAEVILPRMIQAGHGHFIGLSSLADIALIPGAPSYSASKAGLSSWLKAVGLAARPFGVAVTTVRFGFVDTKMAQGRWKPWLMTRERAARFIITCLRTRPLQASHPRLATLTMQAASALLAMRTWFA